MQRQAIAEPIILVAAPGYLAASEPLESPGDLGRHAALVTRAADPRWVLMGAGRAEVSVNVAMAANESTMLLAAAIAGLGVACLPASMCGGALDAGALVRVLPSWNAGTVTTTLLLPHRRGQLPGVRATVEFLLDCLRAETPP